MEQKALLASRERQRPESGHDRRVNMRKGLGRRSSCLIAGAILFCSGCNNQDTDRLANVARAVAVKFQALTGGADGKVMSGWQTLRGNLDAATLEARVL